jgi:hypothetical protein
MANFNLNFIAYLSKYCMMMCVLGCDPLAVRWLYCSPLSTVQEYYFLLNISKYSIRLFASYEILEIYLYTVIHLLAERKIVILR